MVKTDENHKENHWQRSPVSTLDGVTKAPSNNESNSTFITKNADSSQIQIGVSDSEEIQISQPTTNKACMPTKDGPCELNNVKVGEKPEIDADSSEIRCLPWAQNRLRKTKKEYW